jgi:hypothetical protein
MKIRTTTVLAVVACAAVTVGAMRSADAAAPTPSQPGSGYILDWERSADWTLPQHAPPGWAAEYWPDVRHADGQPQVRVAQAANGEPVRAGAHSVRFELDKADRPKNNGSRAEIGAEAPVEPRGVERWYGFSTYLPTSWTPDPAPEIIAQWHQSGGDCSAGCSPPLSIITRNGRYLLSQNWQNTAGVPGSWTFSETPIGAYRTGGWTDWVVHVRWSTGSAGLLEVWKDGQPVQGFEHKIGRNDDFGDGLHGNYLVLGIYKWPWSQANPPVRSTVSNRVLYTDELRIADGNGSYAAVAPPVHLSVTSALRVTPGPAGSPTTARFTVTNGGGAPVTIPYLLVGSRSAGGANVDFPASAPVTLASGQSHTYQASRSLPAGSYTAWPAYYDGSTWRELGPHVASLVTS